MSLDQKIPTLTLMRAILDEMRLPTHFAHLIFKSPSLLLKKAGHGEPVYVIPGYLASDRSTIVLRKFLTWQGYDVFDWGLGTNQGNKEDLIKKISVRLKKIYSDKQKKITLIGWSLGGFFAREVAREFPDLVSHVITLGTPNKGGPKLTAFERRNQKNAEEEIHIAKIIAQREKNPIKVPITSIYSKSDRVVFWHASRDSDVRHQVKHLEVNSSHGGLGFHPVVYKMILEALANLK